MLDRLLHPHPRPPTRGSVTRTSPSNHHPGFFTLGPAPTRQLHLATGGNALGATPRPRPDPDAPRVAVESTKSVNTNVAVTDADNRPPPPAKTTGRRVWHLPRPAVAPRPAPTRPRRSTSEGQTPQMYPRTLGRGRASTPERASCLPSLRLVELEATVFRRASIGPIKPTEFPSGSQTTA